MAIFNIHINQQVTTPVGGENIITGSLVYLASDGKWYNTTATDKTKSTTEIKLAITNSITEDEIEFISYGEYTYPTGTLVAGAKYYMSVLSGQITTTVYNNSTNVIRYIGTAKNTAVLLFNPDQTYISDYNSTVNDVIIKASNNINNSHTHLEEDISDLDKYTMNQVDILTNSLGWKLNVDSIFKSKITNDNTINFIGGIGIDLTYSAINNTITSILDLSELPVSTILSTDWIAFDDAGISSKALISSIPLSYFNNNLGWTSVTNNNQLTNGAGYTTNTGTVTSVGKGNGMDFTAFSTSGIITLGTPSTLTALTTNALTANSHTHAITGFEPSLGNPTVNGYILSSTTLGVRSWIAPSAGGGIALTDLSATTPILYNNTTGVFSHSTAAGDKHIPTGGATGQFLKYSASGTAVWAADNDTIYTHPTGDGNLHVPATSTTNNGKVLTAGATAGSLSWVSPGEFLVVNAGTITTTVSITNATLTDDGLFQNGKVIRIANGANVINFTVNAGLTASFVKGGTGAITFVQGAGRTLTGVNGTLVFNGAVDSKASIVSFGTNDYLYIEAVGYWTATGNDIQNINTGEVFIKPASKLSILNAAGAEVAKIGNNGNFTAVSGGGFFGNDGASGVYQHGNQLTFRSYQDGFHFEQIYQSSIDIGEMSFISFKSGFNIAPTSGTRITNLIGLVGVINQTGGANGITRALYINPTLTSAFDFRAIEVTAGKSIFQEIIANKPIRLKNYTVATLPTGTQGDTAYVTDALAPTFMGIIVGGGTVVTPVFFNGTNWISH